jgi:acyl transferase domain-containing protein/3-hydroxymyristoyl/3-hydroxydecanoyl-(acyl carrier protein) dehydratase
VSDCRFAPIAIVGRSCVLPGALDPDALWQAVRAGRDLITNTPADRWGIPLQRVLSQNRPAPGPPLPDRVACARGGYVSGFIERFDPTGFRVPAEQILPLDPLFQWVLHCAREALRDAGQTVRREPDTRAGLILGNLSYPSSSMTRFAESIWLERAGVEGRGHPPHPLNRFMSGAPAHLAARALGFAGGAFALDAACASSLYALKLACDRLHDGIADVMLAGAVNRADDLFLHIGFTALGALSPTGQSRPFHKDADGLLPAEGASLVVLKRLDDAIDDGDSIHGVIRGIGLSNDGRGTGLLAPAEEGQRRAMQQAYSVSGLTPAQIGLLECHATGTPVGDATEVHSAGAVFADIDDALPIGSIKSNLGHLITVAGMAGILKLLGALRDGVLPPTLHADVPLAALAGTSLRLITRETLWSSARPRRAALSAFGFGGNNAHLIVEEWSGSRSARIAVPEDPATEIAVVGIGVAAAGAENTQQFARTLFSGESRVRPRPEGGSPAGWTEAVELDAATVRFPPRDLQQALPQQLLALETARQAVAGLVLPPRERVSVLVGMQTDTAVTRYGGRWRIPERVTGDGGDSASADDSLRALRAAFAPPLLAAGVVGTMPNVCANRLNSQFDFAGPSFSVSAEELSGLTGLEIARRALRTAEIDAALVTAVDVSSEQIHEAAARGVLEGALQTPGDAAVSLVLTRVADARRDGNPVLAILSDDEPPAEPDLRLGLAAGAQRLTSLFGHAHAASGLVHVAAAILSLRHSALPGTAQSPGRPWLTSATAQRAHVQMRSHTQEHSRVSLRRGNQARATAPPGVDGTRVYVFSGNDRDGVRAAIERGEELGDGRARLAIVAFTRDEYEARAKQASDLLAAPTTRQGTIGDGIAFFEQPLGGELAFVFTAPAGAYPGMGRDLMLGYPQLAADLAARFRGLNAAAGWVFASDAEPRGVDKLWGSSLLCQVHAGLSRGVFGLQPRAAIGFSSGETNALYAMGAWTDFDGLYEDIESAQIYSRELAGTFDAVRRAWGLAPGTPVRWKSWRVLAPRRAVREAVAGEARVHVTIVNAPGDSIISGDADGCERVIAQIGRERARELGYDIAVHCPELAEARDIWWRIHHRPTRSVPGVRFYTHATSSHYSPTSESAADALLEQALGPIDFPALIERAWRDGVRVFLEHGPRDACSRWIDRILGDRSHLSVALDIAGQSSLERAAHALALLWAAGLDVNPAAFSQPTRGASSVSARPLRFPVHRVPPDLDLPAITASPAVLPPPAEAGIQDIPKAPQLPRILEATTSPRSETRSASRRSDHGAQEPAAVNVPLASLVAQQNRITAIHRRFVEQQAEMHRRFLATRAWHEVRGGPETAPPGSVSASAPRLDLSALDTQPAPDALPRPKPHEAPPRSLESAPEGLTSSRRGDPLFSRADLERLASGRVSDVFGPSFRGQDGFRRQVRMPEPPLLLADRVVSIDAEARSMGRGTIWTETDVTQRSWYLHEGQMPAGVMIEAGQADLLLISWLGIDFLNRGERIYRLLGCELTYRGGLPQPGDTLRYDIHVDGHARHGDVRLFFFHYDCRVDGEPRLEVRQGQAGFFTDEELSDSGGVLWDAASDESTPRPRLDATVVSATARVFDRTRVEAFANGRADECFGEGFGKAATHTCPPRIPAGPMQLFQEVTDWDPRGGAWQRGYLRATWQFTPEDWFFEGHFKDDPCMPGTLMFEGCLQTMAFYLAACGFTLDRDGWRFGPVPDETYKLQCRGQALPSSRELVYELFVDELIAEPEPTLFADLLCTVDGVKAFHCRRMGLRLIPGFPMPRRGEDVYPTPRSDEAAILRGGVKHDERAMLATAWGAPSSALGSDYSAFDTHRRLARLPAPPYQFLSRVTALDGEIGELGAGSRARFEYDIPQSASYFDGDARMPFSVLLEAALQPCGWLALATGAPTLSPEPLSFRNLDGALTVVRELTPGCGTLVTDVELTSLSKTAGMVLLNYDVTCSLANAPVLKLQTGFGFFPPEALARQVGVPTGDADRERLIEPGGSLDLDALLRKAPSSLRVANGDLLMLDRVTGFWKDGGSAGLGRLRAEKDVDPREWFFKAHFFQDPVQPGSLGLEALYQLLRVYVLERGLFRGAGAPRFEPIALGETLEWKYRGEVVPHNERVTLEVDVSEVTEEPTGGLVRANGWLWVDGTRVYSASGLTARVRSD